MQLEKIEIKGFRGISDLVVSDLGRINLIVGKNNCSKTSLLESIFILAGAGNPEIIFKINQLRNLFFTEAEDLRLIFNNLDYETHLHVWGKYNVKNATRELTIKPGKRSLQVHSTTRKTGVTDFDDINTATGELVVNELLLELKTKSQHSTAKNYTGSLSFNQNEFTFKPPKDYKEDQKAIFLSSSSFALSNTLEKRLENFIVNKQEGKIIKILQAVEPAVSKITLGTNRMIYVDIGINRLIPLNLMGDGMRRMLSIILGISEVNNGIVLIDEIDNGLHFSAMTSLWKTVLEASKEFNVQVFATTHNFEVVKYLKEVLETPEMSSEQNCVRNITLRRLPNGSLKSYVYIFEKLSHTIDQRIEFR